MRNKKSKIRYDRIFLLIAAGLVIILGIRFGFKSVKNKISKVKLDKVQENSQIEVGDNKLEIEKIIPEALNPGDTIGIISPAGSSDKVEIDRGVSVLENLGYKVKIGKYAYENNGYLSSSDENRVADLNDMFRDKEVKAIICIRGGYGTPRIIEDIDYEAIRENPKIFMGYSDITAVLNAINQKVGLVTFHGPMIRSEIQENFTGSSLEYFNSLITKENKDLIIQNPGDIEAKTIVAGSVEGELVGGNLSILVGLFGTDYEVDTKGKILFIEDTDESMPRLDRMFNQLKLAGKLEDASGIILGDFNNMDPAGVERLVVEYFGNLEIPVLYNLKSGHSKPNISLPIGGKIRLDTNKKEITILETVVK